MKHSSKFQSGQIILIAYPFTDLSRAKVRPALVIRDQIDSDLLIAPISTTVNKGREDYVIQESDYQESKLPIESCIRYQKIFTLESKLAIKVVSTLKTGTTKKLKEKIAEFILS